MTPRHCASTHLTADQWRRLEQLRAELGMTTAEVLRLAIDELLERERHTPAEESPRDPETDAVR